MAGFAATLQGLREAAGYPSARAFFLRAGGARFFGCTYKQYRNAEAGRSLPGPRLAERLVDALRLEARPPDARRFVESYLRELAGERVAALALGAPGGAAPHDKALERGFDRPRHLSEAETDWIHRRPEHYWAFIVLTSDSAAWDAEGLARLSGLSAARMRRALAGLAKLRLVKKERGGRWRGAYADRPILAYPDDPARSRYFPLCESHLGLADGRRGETLLRQHVIVRASEAELAHYKPVLVRALQGAGLYSVSERGPDTALFFLEARLRRVTPL